MPDLPATQWYYTSGSERKGPVSLDEMLTLIGSGVVSRTTLVWHDQLPDWTQAALVGLPFVGPPPLAATHVSDALVWIVSVLPLAGLLVVQALDLGALGSFLLFFIAYSALCFADERALKTAGYDVSTLGVWWLFLIPVYLWKRAKLLKQVPAYFWVWIGCVVVSLF